MAFEKYFKIYAERYKPKASIWRRGQIGFNEGAIKKYNLRDFSYAILLYDKDNKQIGVKFTNNASELETFKVSKKKGASVVISAKAFLDFYKIDHSKTIRFNIDYDEKNDLYILKNI